MLAVLVSNSLYKSFCHQFPVYTVMGLIYLISPLLGLLGEKWARYKVLLVGAILISIGCLFVFVAMLRTYYWLFLPFIVLYTLGLNMFGSNIIQFGIDQLQFAPSHEISSFVYWSFWIYFTPASVIAVILALITSFDVPHGDIIVISVLIFFVFAVITSVFLSACCCRRSLTLEPSQHNNPVKLIYGVIKYAWKQKQPARPSAFTYGDPPPSRLDVAKERYGGQFTTEEVESVKAFLNMIMVIAATFGLGLQDTTAGLSNLHLLEISQDNYTFINTIVLTYPSAIPYIVMSCYIFIRQLVVVPFCSCCIPGMLKRIWIGLILVLLQSAIVLFISVYMFSNSNCHLITGACGGVKNFSVNCTLVDNNSTLSVTIPVIITAQAVSGLSNMLIFVTIFEFILAQGPRTMQGLLIGISLMRFFLTFLDMGLSKSSIGSYWQYYSAKTCLIFMSVITYSVAAYKYKYRQCNELSDVNERIIISQYFGRQIEWASQNRSTQGRTVH